MLAVNSFFRAGAMAAHLVLSVAGLSLAVLPAESVAQSQGGWRKELADKAAQAQAAGQNGNYSEAIRLLKEAKTNAPLSPQEEQGINELLIWAASGAKEHKLVLATVDERLATGRVAGADLTRKLRLKATTHYALRDYRNAAAAFDKLAAQGALTADDLTLLGTSQVQLRDFGRAATTIEKAIAANDKAGRTSKNGPLLEMLNSAYFETKQDAKRKETLHRLMAVAPKAKVFDQLVNVYANESGKDPVVMVNLYRLGAAKGLLSGDQFVDYAERALDLSSPGEAVAALEKGMAAGAVKKDDRNNKVLADAKGQVVRVKSTLVQQEKEAQAIKTGEPDAKLATTYFTLRNYPKAAEAAQRAVTKGNLKRADDVHMVLGIALANQKKSADAKKAFTAAGAANTRSKDVANLWSSVG
ncbi:MAG: tetratricopeptide repeat protein [Gammaproteobacteria bacterium]|nr:tetratricopeptide repeat protein [Gammaproteobacteria bacterium]